MKWMLLSEERIPNDVELFDASFESDENPIEYSPTIDFLEYAYSRLNDELFENDVSSNKPVEFKLIQLIGKSGNKLGYAEINKDDDTNEIKSYCIVLNKSAKLTIHGWYEVVLHEMIHIYEEEYFPENMNAPDYDQHGKWFKNQCDKFKKYGFNVNGTYGGQFGIEDDNEVTSMLTDYIYLQPGTRNGNPDLFKVYSDDKDKWIEFIKGHSSIETCAVWKTSNVNSFKLPAYDFPPNASNGVNTNNLTDEFNAKYGPFEKVDEVEIGHVYFKETTNESKDDSSTYFRFDTTYQPEDDEQMKEIRRRYGENLVFVEKTDTGYRYGIS